jgi:hypothetical protein
LVTIQTVASGAVSLGLSQPAILDADGTEITAISLHNGHVGIAYASGDADADGVLDATDNCLAAQNPSQRNDDANFIDQTPPQPVDDKTWINSDANGNACDTDDDNDGRLDTAEPAGCNGSSALDPTNRDTDGDLFLDGAECALSTNPTNPTSKPLWAACATYVGPGVTIATDTDGDKIKDYIEFCFYNSNPNVTDTDGDIALDGAKDGCEVASLNSDRIVNSGDQGVLLGAIQDPTKRTANVDINKDGSYNSGDQGLMASFIPAGQCP